DPEARPCRPLFPGEEATASRFRRVSIGASAEGHGGIYGCFNPRGKCAGYSRCDPESITKRIQWTRRWRLCFISCIVGGAPLMRGVGRHNAHHNMGAAYFIV